MAYGALELKPREFEQLQPHEFMQLVEGYIWRKEQQENIFAFFTCHLMNVEGKSLKKGVQPKDILKPLRAKVVKRNKPDDAAYLKEKFKIGG